MELEDYIGARFEIKEDIGDVLAAGMIVEATSVDDDKLIVHVIDRDISDYLLINEIDDEYAVLISEKEVVIDTTALSALI